MITRRAFLAAPAGLIVAVGGGRALAARTGRAPFDLRAFERARVLRLANAYLREAPITITAASSPRSAGGLHDFFSEGDYWWPDPSDPAAPYIQRDGMTNPDNFVAHRQALMRLSLHVPALAAAWTLTQDRRYADHAVRHLRAWFVDPATRMNPNLLYAQAIHGRVTGRGVGIIDTIHLVEVVRAAGLLERPGAVPAAVRAGVHGWFVEYVRWMTSHPYGIAERDSWNNHATCWAMQVAAFADYVGEQGLLALCRARFKGILVPSQIAPDGRFPEELRRTKPYGYSLFNLEAMATLCWILSTPADNLWTYETADGRGVRHALAFMAPFIADKRTWPFPPDVMYFDEWPMRQAALLFGGLAFDVPADVDLWRTLHADSDVEEVVRNFFIRQPVLWAT